MNGQDFLFYLDYLDTLQDKIR